MSRDMIVQCKVDEGTLTWRYGVHNSAGTRLRVWAMMLLVDL